MKLAADRIRETSKRCETPVLGAETAATLMVMGANEVLHCIRLELMGKRSISTAKLFDLFAEQHRSLDALTGAK